MLEASRDIARELGCAVVEPQHVLAALLRDEGTVATQLLMAVGVDTARVRAAVDSQLPKGAPRAEAWRPTFGIGVGEMLESAHLEALFLGPNPLGSEHVLLVLFSRVDVPLVSTLRALGWDARRVRDEIATLVDPRSVEARRLKAHFNDVRRLRKEDFPQDLWSDPILELLLSQPQFDVASFARDPFVRSALGRCPTGGEELMRYVVEEYTKGIRALREGEAESES
jgi:ATP-dependent Clp protease ATP-binding subunit ClpA